jgi:FtsZ-interacting cell division protein ZipA
MSDLQLALIALGAVVIAGVILFNWWQERRFMQESVRRFEGPVDDALMQEFRFDPEKVVALDRDETEPEEIAETYVAADEALVEDLEPDDPLEEMPEMAENIPEPFEPEPEESPAVQDSLPEQAAAVAPAGQDLPVSGMGELPDELDEQVDLVALATLQSALGCAALNQSLQMLPKFDKPMRCYGQDYTGVWHPLPLEQGEAEFTQMACALQLADRAGPVSLETLNKFRDRMEILASSLGASLAWRGDADPLRYSTELDQFCVDVDVMVGFHVIQGASGSFAGTKLRGLAEAGGMKLHDDGAFHYENDSGETLFTLVSQDQRPLRPETLRTVFYRGISFQLDVPRVKNCSEVFNQMTLLARQMEASLEGVLVDERQHPLDDAAIDRIRQQLKGIQNRMVARGIIPGSPTALRLFS